SELAVGGHLDGEGRRPVDGELSRRDRVVQRLAKERFKVPLHPGPHGAKAGRRGTARAGAGTRPSWALYRLVQGPVKSIPGARPLLGRGCRALRCSDAPGPRRSPAAKPRAAPTSPGGPSSRSRGSAALRASASPRRSFPRTAGRLLHARPNGAIADVSASPATHRRRGRRPCRAGRGVATTQLPRARGVAGGRVSYEARVKRAPGAAAVPLPASPPPARATRPRRGGGGRGLPCR